MKIYNSFEEMFDSISVDQFKQLSTKEKKRYTDRAKVNRYRNGTASLDELYPSYPYSGDNLPEDVDRMEFSNVVKEQYNRMIRDANAHQRTDIDYNGMLVAVIQDVANRLYNLEDPYYDGLEGYWEFSNAKFNPDGTLKSILVQTNKFVPKAKEQPIKSDDSDIEELPW